MGATEPGVIGQSVRRKEDLRFLTGAGQYTDDINMARQTAGARRTRMPTFAASTLPRPRLRQAWWLSSPAPT